jgi:hypothetical protein
VASGQEDRVAAVQMMTAIGRTMASQLRALRPQPFGLVNDVLLPAFAGSCYQSAAADSGPHASPLGAVTSMALCYGIPEDRQSPYLEVLTDFTPGHRDTVSLRSAIGRVIAAEKSRQQGVHAHLNPRHAPMRGPLGGGRLEIVVEGKARTVRTASYETFQGLQFSHPRGAVTVTARGNWPERPAFSLVADLEPYLAAIESPDSEVVAAKLRALQAACYDMPGQTTGRNRPV